ncbi:hypothetical protein H4S06_004415 [Coemansia sp. BCRC 34490]|nr:hypothetical protein H4S06_004415 [Coemansia sp. BCRC 34490]
MSQHPSSPMFGRPDTLLSSAMAMDGSGLQLQQLQQQQQSQNQSLALPLALTRNQYSIECGGVLLDPATNEVCLLFYPDTSEWRLPMGKPDAMGRQGSPPAGTDASVAGCEPPAHAAQRQITLITGYRCTHVHPAVAAGTPPAACAYIGPRMVEPLALQIEQRVVAQCETPVLGGAAELPNATSSNNSGLAQLTPPGSGSEAAAASALSPATAAADDDYQLPRTPSTRLVMTYYYTAWLTQSRFEAKAATLPVGPAGSASAGNPPGAFEDGVLTTLGATAPPAAAARDGLPLAEVTWFKMDTAAQVLTHESDKLALREAIHRMSRLSAAEAASQARYSALALAQHSQTAAADSADLLGANQGRLARGEAAAGLLQLQPAADAAAIGFGADSGAAGVGGEAQTANETAAESAASASASSSSSSSSLSDGATKADDSAVAKASSASRPSNLDIIRKTATSITKRGGSLFAKSKAAAVGANDAQSDSSKQLVSTKSKRQARQNQNQSQSQQQPSSSSSPPNKQHLSAAAVSAATSTTANGKQAIVPRVMSIFYKLVGPSSSSSSNNNSNASNAAAA